MNKTDLIAEVTKVLGTQIEARQAVEAVVHRMRDGLRSGEKVVLHGFGSFHVVMTKAKKGRNPKTGQVYPIPPRRRVKFTLSKDFF